MKTGSLFACAAQLGATISGAPQEVVGLLKNYGARIGTAYQIYDDCLDIAGTESETGKTLGTDLRKGKLTLPVLTLLESASAFDRERCCALVLEGRLEEVAALLQSAPADGAFGAALDTAAELIRGAQSELAPLVTNRCVDSLFGLGEALLELLEQLRS
jgi:octaprenyl-diphosphate synthase